ncbi:hypothetical protein BJX70DRAFT_2363 [Aspergillus crustosus]
MDREKRQGIMKTGEEVVRMVESGISRKRRADSTSGSFKQSPLSKSVRIAVGTEMIQSTATMAAAAEKVSAFIGKKCRERDSSGCVVTHAPDYNIVAPINRYTHDTEREFWTLAKLFWGIDKVEEWKTSSTGSRSAHP